MQASLCPRFYDADAPLQFPVLDSSSDVDTVTRRVTRRATLDQSAAFYDAGYSDADRTIVLALMTEDRETVELGKWFAKTHSSFTVSTKEGCFICSIESVRYGNGILTVTLLIKEEA